MALKSVIDKIRQSNEVKGGYTYKYITIDTISALEDNYAPDLALALYNNGAFISNYKRKPF